MTRYTVKLSCADRRKASGEQLTRKACARRRGRREGWMRAARRTGTARRSELVLVEQLALVLEVVDSARARQVGGNVDACATPAAVGRGQSAVSNAALARQTRKQRAGSGRQLAGRAAHPSCPASARFQHFDPEESRTCGIHCIQDPVYNPALLPKKQMANRSRTALIYFSRAHTTEVSPSAGGISFRRKRITNERGGQAHPCDGCHRTQPGCPRQILGYTGRRHLTHELDIQRVGITRSWRWDISTPLDVTGGLRHL
jgi:hypothetical protein